MVGFQRLRILPFLLCFLFLISGCGGTEKETANSDQEAEEGVANKAEETSKPSPLTPMPPEPVEFASLDELAISAIIYKVDPGAPTILLCHQARYNKAEYEGTAEKLNTLGYNCIAIDQRSGGPIRDKENETHQRAADAGKGVEYLDAEQDIIAAIDYTSDRFTGPLVLWGSSYSSTLALYQGIANEKVAAVVSFSPGNYFAEEKGSLVEMLEGFEKPFFLTSSLEEAPELTNLLAKVELNEHQVQFKPEGAGYHGSKALWEGQPGGEEYWSAIESFLSDLKSVLGENG